MQTTVYTLPEISFVGGETQDINFCLKNQNGESFNAGGFEVDFSICNYSNKSGMPILSYSPDIIADENDVESIISVIIPKEDTAQLSGKFIYQITIIDMNGVSKIPNQGIMNISKNIHQEYVLQ